MLHVAKYAQKLTQYTFDNYKKTSHVMGTAAQPQCKRSATIQTTLREQPERIFQVYIEENKRKTNRHRCQQIAVYLHRNTTNECCHSRHRRRQHISSSQLQSLCMTRYVRVYNGRTDDPTRGVASKKLLGQPARGSVSGTVNMSGAVLVVWTMLLIKQLFSEMVYLQTQQVVCINEEYHRRCVFCFIVRMYVWSKTI